MRHGDASLSAALVPLLESERPAVRSAVLEIMGSWRDPHALPFLTRRLKEDPDPATRVRAVLALKELADDRVVEPLLAATLDREKAVRLWAGAALKEWLPRLGQGELRERVEAALTRRQVSPREGLNQGGGGL
jgi:HEAT repeat protein